jgi:hypothetical protein
MLVCVTCKGTGLIFKIVESDTGKGFIEECPKCNS